MTDPRRCKCHDVPLIWAGNWRCAVKRRAAGRRNSQRYRRTSQRYVEQNRAKNARRILIGRNYHSVAATPELAEQINDHIRRRVSEFKQRLAAGEEA